MNKENIIEYDIKGLYDSGNRDFFEDCIEYLQLNDSPQVRMIFEKSLIYALGHERVDWLEAFEDWIEVLEVK